MRKLTEQELQRAKALISDYLELRSLSFGDNHKEAISKGHQNSKAIKEVLEKNRIDQSWFGVINPRSDEENIISRIFKDHPELDNPKNKEICSLYIKMKKQSIDIDRRKEATKQKILNKIAKIDPMLANYILFRVKVFQAKKVLERTLVNETPETLEARYLELLKDFDI